MVLTRRALTQLGFPEKSASLIENIHPAVIENRISKLESGRRGKRQKKNKKTKTLETIGTRTLEHFTGSPQTKYTLRGNLRRHRCNTSGWGR